MFQLPHENPEMHLTVLQAMFCGIIKLPVYFLHLFPFFATLKQNYGECVEMFFPLFPNFLDFVKKKWLKKRFVMGTTN